MLLLSMMVQAHDLVLPVLEMKCEAGWIRELTLELDIGAESKHDVGLGMSPFFLFLPMTTGLGLNLRNKGLDLRLCLELAQYEGHGANTFQVPCRYLCAC